MGRSRTRTTSTSPSARRPTRPVAGTSTGSTSPTTAPTPGASNPGPYLGDYPHIGADANGFYVTTNAYPWCCNGFDGAQIYALSKAQLAAGAASVAMQHIDTSGMVNVQARRARRSRASPLAGAVAWNRLLRVGQRRHRVLPELERGGRSDASCQRHGWRPHVEPDRAVDAQEHVLPELRDARCQPQQHGCGGEPVRAAAEATSTRFSFAAPGMAVPQGFCINDTTTATIRASAAGVCCSRPSRHTTK